MKKILKVMCPFCGKNYLLKFIKGLTYMGTCRCGVKIKAVMPRPKNLFGFLKKVKKVRKIISRSSFFL